MEVWILLGVIIFLLGFVVFKEILQYKERHELTKKLMAKDFIQYTNATLQEAAIKKQPEKKENNLQPF